MYWWLAACDILLVTMGKKYIFLVKLLLKLSCVVMPSIHTGEEITYRHSVLRLYVNILVHNYLFVNTTTERLVLYYCKRKIHYNFYILGTRIHYLHSWVFQSCYLNFVNKHHLYTHMHTHTHTVAYLTASVLNLVKYLQTYSSTSQGSIMRTLVTEKSSAFLTWVRPQQVDVNTHGPYYHGDNTPLSQFQTLHNI